MNDWEKNHSHSRKLRATNNILIIKDELGKAKPTVRKLPHSEFRYGKAIYGDNEGLGAVISSWKLHEPSNYYN